jgi:hypothetical protein
VSAGSAEFIIAPVMLCLVVNLLSHCLFPMQLFFSTVIFLPRLSNNYSSAPTGFTEHVFCNVSAVISVLISAV